MIELDSFCFAFGVLRQTIWKVSPAMRREMLALEKREGWHHYQTKQNQADAYRVAQRLAESTGKRHRRANNTVAPWNS